MAKIEAVQIDSREPEWVQSLTFGGAPTAVLQLAYGDLHVLLDDGNTLVIERKTSDDLLNSLRDDRLLPQMVRLSNLRVDQQVAGTMTAWPYLVITGLIYRSPAGRVVTSSRGTTQWSWDAMQGALLSIQEMGVMVIVAGEDDDFEACVQRIARRKRDELLITPPRPAHILGPGAAFLAGLPGVGVEHSLALMAWSGNNVADALAGITDLEIECPLPKATRMRVRRMLGLRDELRLDLTVNQHNQSVFSVQESQ